MHNNAKEKKEKKIGDNNKSNSTKCETNKGEEKANITEENKNGPEDKNEKNSNGTAI